MTIALAAAVTIAIRGGRRLPRGPEVPVHVVFPPRSPQPPRVTAFIERLVAGKRLSRR
ncbi:hypothetical protein [Pendulispora albinea]|uniref:LysR family transcriptional regulator n=1 Tax=Pendulispora albinea TaxID=2741071 RepID=A0ABZ2MBY3_9BACT